jgi:acyl-lipid omega-6 desaturase (Delta-12 desaturase)
MSASPATGQTPTPDPLWREALAPYTRPRPWRVALDILTGPVAYLAMWALMVAMLDVSYWLVLALAVPGAGFLLRTFILFHDCTHGSLWAGRRANLWCGRLFGLLVLHPFQSWRHHHAVHHGSAGDLDRRGTGDVPTLTGDEYEELPARGKLAYRLFRNPLVMFGIGPIWALVVQPRIPPKKGSTALKRSVWLTNAAVLVAVGAACLVLGWQQFLLIQGPMVMLAGTAGVWLFFVQHQFEDVYWESSDGWSYADAALRGSSYLKLPQPLQFFTGNIGLHHVHHLSARVPNYNLQAAHDDLDVFHDVPVLTMWQSLRCYRLKLIDQRSGRLVTFREARRSRRIQSEPVPSPVG